jgi:hypothetical protein
VRERAADATWLVRSGLSRPRRPRRNRPRPGDATAETASTLLTPGNNPGALGLTRAMLDGAAPKVDAVASGLTPGQVHPFHLHGPSLDDRPERPAIAADDADGDGFVGTAEARPTPTARPQPA